MKYFKYIALILAIFKVWATWLGCFWLGYRIIKHFLALLIWYSVILLSATCICSNRGELKKLNNFIKNVWKIEEINCINTWKIYKFRVNFLLLSGHTPCLLEHLIYASVRNLFLIIEKFGIFGWSKGLMSSFE